MFGIQCSWRRHTVYKFFSARWVLEEVVLKDIMPGTEVLDDCEHGQVSICMCTSYTGHLDCSKHSRLLDSVFNFIFREYAKLPLTCALFSSVLFSPQACIKHLSSGSSSQTMVGNCSLNACQRWQLEQMMRKMELQQKIWRKQQELKLRLYVGGYHYLH